METILRDFIYVRHQYSTPIIWVCSILKACMLKVWPSSSCCWQIMHSPWSAASPRKLDHCGWKHEDMVPSCPFLFAVMEWRLHVPLAPTKGLLPCHRLKGDGQTNHGLKPQRPWAKINISCSKGIYLRYFVTITESCLIPNNF